MRWLREYFQLDKRQERGLFILLLVLIAVIFLNHYLPYYFSTSKDSLIASKLYVEQIQVYKYADQKKKSSKIIKKEETNPILAFDFTFDPNTVTKEQLLDANIPHFLANNWVKFRTKGGKFYKKEDIKKLYGMTEEAYQQMEVWIEIEPVETTETHNSQPNEKIKIEPYTERETTPSIVLGINSADSSQFLQLRGIGAFYSAAIVKYRNRLGGYTSLSQLMELYKMDSTKLLRILPQIYLDSIEIRKIPLNSIEFKELLKHPYIDYETTKYIMNKRNKLGKFAAVYQIKDSTMMPDSLYQKILPYLKLDD